VTQESAKPGKLLKTHMIEQIASCLQNATSLFITDCGRLTNKELEDLRGRLKKISSNYIVVKNSMCIKAIENIKVFNLDKIKELIYGTCGISYGEKDPVLISKVLAGFTKENEKLKLKGACIDGEFVSTDTVKELATIPSKEVLLARLVSSLNSPISGVVVLLSNAVKQFVCALNAIKDKRQEEGGEKNV
jgi:large subunit ribosomal protein L10